MTNNSKNKVELKTELKEKTDNFVSQNKELFANLSKEEITEKKKERAKKFREENRDLLDGYKILKNGEVVDKDFLENKLEKFKEEKREYYKEQSKSSDYHRDSWSSDQFIVSPNKKIVVYRVKRTYESYRPGRHQDYNWLKVKNFETGEEKDILSLIKHFDSQSAFSDKDSEIKEILEVNDDGTMKYETRSWKIIESKINMQKILTNKEKQNKKLEELKKKEILETTKKNLLNKPNMTPKDKEWMQKAIDFLVERNMDTSGNLKRLDAIVYTQESINIGGVKRTRKDISAKPNSETILEYDGLTYFRRSKKMIEEQNTLLSKQDMKIPSERDYKQSIYVLPVISENASFEDARSLWRYLWGILAFIIDMSEETHQQYYHGYGSGSGFRWTASQESDATSKYFEFSKYGTCSIHSMGNYYALPIRPVFK